MTSARPNESAREPMPVLEPHHFVTEPMESEHHLVAMILLYQLVSGLTRGRDVFVGADLVVYFSALQAKNKDFRAPDLFVVTNVSPHERQGWIVWEEGDRYPDLVVEHMSPSTRSTDLGEKLRVYDRVWRVKEYYAFDLATGELHAFGRGPNGLERRTPDERGHYPSTVLEASFGVAREGYDRVRRPVLRLYDAEGAALPTSDELARSEHQRAQAEAQRAQAEARQAEAERRRADALEAELRALKARLGR
jgi:Uma2 family endonuclease